MLAVGRALVTRPRLLLVDEMSLGLAPVIVERMMPVLRRVAEELGTAVLFVEQHVALALEVADRAYVLNHGHLVLEGRQRSSGRNPSYSSPAISAKPRWLRWRRQSSHEVWAQQRERCRNEAPGTADRPGGSRNSHRGCAWDAAVAPAAPAVRLRPAARAARPPRRRATDRLAVQASAPGPGLAWDPAQGNGQPVRLRRHQPRVGAGDLPRGPRSRAGGRRLRQQLPERASTATRSSSRRASATGSPRRRRTAPIRSWPSTRC